MPNQTNNTELIAWLEIDEAASREWRACRLSHLLKVIPVAEEWNCSVNGELSCKSFDEIRLSYIHGLDLATVLLSLAYIEREVAGRLYAAGWEKAKSVRLEELLLKANECGILSNTELDTFQYLRRIRNTYAHYRPPSHSTLLLSRTVDQNELANDVIEADARRAIEALGSFFERQGSLF